jgi:hypothetical protein
MSRIQITTGASLLCAGLLLLVTTLVYAASEIGVVAIVNDTTVGGKKLNINDAISTGSVISTSEKGNITILFNDESLLTLGPNSEATIESFSTEPPPGEAKINVSKGSYQFFPGKITEAGGDQVVISNGAQSTTLLQGGNDTEVPVQDTATAGIDDTRSEQLSDLQQTLSDVVNVNDVVDVTETTQITSGAGAGNIGGGDGPVLSGE